jgi:two-component system response regulator HydG
VGRILIIEGQPSVRLALRRFFETREGHACAVAQDLSTLPPPPFDVTLLDYDLLGPDPAVRLHRSLGTSEAGRIVVMTRPEAWPLARQLLDAGVFACVLKPVDFETLGPLVRRFLKADRPRSGAVQTATDPPPSGVIVSQSPSMQRVLDQIARLAPHDITVLITGESGTGKELVARALHAQSPRHDEPFEAIHCGAIPADLLESELFGHERGAFTDAHRTKIGRFEAAGAGTIFLDEIGEMPLALQVKLLRALQDKEIQRVGGLTPIPMGARIVAATHRDLRERVRQERFREDLLHRLLVARVDVPPLRTRVEDIDLLAGVFLGRFARRFGKPVEGIDCTAMERLRAYPWPGNVRELENLLQRAVVLCEGPVLGEKDLSDLPQRLHGGDAGEASADPDRWLDLLSRVVAAKIAAGDDPEHLAETLSHQVRDLVRHVREEPNARTTSEETPEPESE